MGESDELRYTCRYSQLPAGSLSILGTTISRQIIRGPMIKLDMRKIFLQIYIETQYTFV